MFIPENNFFKASAANLSKMFTEVFKVIVNIEYIVTILKAKTTRNDCEDRNSQPITRSGLRIVTKSAI